MARRLVQYEQINAVWIIADVWETVENEPNTEIMVSVSVKVDDLPVNYTDADVAAAAGCAS